MRSAKAVRLLWDSIKARNKERKKEEKKIS
jgi:hypothetical protein